MCSVYVILLLTIDVISRKMLARVFFTISKLPCWNVRPASRPKQGSATPALCDMIGDEKVDREDQLPPPIRVCVKCLMTSLHLIMRSGVTRSDKQLICLLLLGYYYTSWHVFTKPFKMLIAIK